MRGPTPLRSGPGAHHAPHAPGASIWFAAALAIACATLTSSTAGAVDVDVWIDPGHGGSDSGAPGNTPGYPEKQATLDVSLALDNSLGGLAYINLLTRHGDTYPTLVQRARMASGKATNDHGEQGTCQLFISIHMNSSTNASAFGTEMYYSPVKKFAKLKTAYLTDASWAQTIYSKLITYTPLAFLGCNSNRGVLQARHVVTKNAEVPATLIEVCFISNACQQGKIRTASNQGIVAQGIATGVTYVIDPILFGAPATRGILPVAAADAAAPLLPDEGPSAWPASATGTQDLSEGFDGAGFPPPGWTVTSLGGPAPFFWTRTTDPLYVSHGAGAAKVGGGSGGAIDEWLISPTVLLGPTDRGLSFRWLGNPVWAAQVDDQCLVRPVGGAQWTPVWSLQSEPQAGEFDYHSRVADLSPWIGNSVQIAFRAVGTNGADVAIDDLVIGNFAPGPLAPPNDLCADAITLLPGPFVFSGSTCYAANDMDPYRPLPSSCVAEPLSAGDVFYRVTVQPGDTLDVNVAADWAPLVYLVNACDTTVATCQAASPGYEPTDTSSAAALHIVFAAGGTYDLAVDGRASECGDFRLTGMLRQSPVGVDDRRAAPGEGQVRIAGFPNPFHGTVHLLGTVPGGGSGSGTLGIFDLAGRRVVERVVAVVAGRCEARWDGMSDAGRRLPGGIYLVRLEVGGLRGSTRVILAE